MARTTLVSQRKAILAEIDRLWNLAEARIKSMESESANPQVAAMITKNEGFKTALEDVNQFIYSIRS